MTDVISWLSEDLPHQIAVYVIYDKREKKIHVISMDVSAKYSIVRAMRSELLYQISENDGDGCGVIAVGDGLFPTHEQHKLLQHIDQLLTQSDYYKNEYKASFYNGVPGRVIMSHFCPQEDVGAVETIDLI